MIYYLVSQAHAYTMLSFLAFRGKSIAGRITVLPYEALPNKKYLKAGTYIFSDIERLSPNQAMAASRIWRALSDAPFEVTLLNHPSRSLTRYGLLRTLHSEGINPYNIYRADESRIPAQFPVFLRREKDHEGSITPLLKTPHELESALSAMEEDGSRKSDILVVEFCETRTVSTLYAKYALFVVGGEVLARHRFTGKNWILKDPEDSHDLFDDEMAYIRRNPHAHLLAPIFDLAAIEYGRIDYSLLNDRPVIWEINTNPMIASTRIPEREKIELHFVEQMIHALASVDSKNESGRVANPIHAGWPDRGKKTIKQLVKHSPLPIELKMRLKTLYKRFGSSDEGAGI